MSKAQSIVALPPKLSCSLYSLLGWCQQAARIAGTRKGPTNKEEARTKDPKREIWELSHCQQHIRSMHERRAMDPGINPSVGTVKELYENALADNIICLFKTQVPKLLNP
jgi:hypothetical protein